MRRGATTAFLQLALCIFRQYGGARECATTLILSITSTSAGAVECLELNEWTADANFSLLIS
jgi:hypothetical protein